MERSIDMQEPVRLWYQRMKEKDWESLRLLAHPAMRFQVSEGFPGGGVYIGPDEIFDRFFLAKGKPYRRIQPHVGLIIPAGEYTVVEGQYAIQPQGEDKEFILDFLHLWRSDGRLLTEMKQYMDTALLRDRLFAANTIKKGKS